MGAKDGLPLFLFCHANGFCKEVWRPVVEELSKIARAPFRWIALDFSGHGDTAKAVKNIKKKGVNILSYFIQSSTTQTKEEELMENFQIMYGKEASFIDPKNMYEVTKTLNNLFLKQNLVS